MRPDWSLRLRRIAGLVRKESLQIVRDPSSYLIAGLLPLLLLFIFGYGVSLDLRRVPVGLVVEQASPEADSLVASFRNSRFFTVRLARHRHEVEDDLVSGRLKAVIVLAADFAERLGRGESAPVQIIVDGSDPNTAGLAENYVQGVWSNWLRQEAVSLSGLAVRPAAAALVSVEPRFWFNQQIESRDFLIPGSIAIIMTLIGTLLTALVVAREWERGTMEALMATPIGVADFLLGKLIPYFVLGMAAMGLSVAVAIARLRHSVSRLVPCSRDNLVGLPCGHAAPGPSDLDRHAKPVRSQPGGADLGVPAGVLALGLHLRDRQHARPDTPRHVRAPGPLLRLQPPDAVPCRRRRQRPGPRHARPAHDRVRCSACCWCGRPG